MRSKANSIIQLALLSPPPCHRQGPRQQDDSHSWTIPLAHSHLGGSCRDDLEIWTTAAGPCPTGAQKPSAAEETVTESRRAETTTET